MLKRFSKFVNGYWILTLLCPVLVCIDVFIELQIPTLMGEIVDLIQSAETTGFSKEALWAKLAELLGICFLTLIIGYCSSRCSAIASMGFGSNMRRALFNKIQDLSFENIDRLKIASLITRMTNDVTSVQSVFSSVIVTFIKGPLLLIMALYYAVSLSPSLSKIFYIAVPAIFITLMVLGYLAVPLFKAMLEKTDKFNAALRSNINGIRVVKSFVREEHEKENFNKVNEEVKKANIKARILVLYITPIIMFVIYGCIVFSLYSGSEILIYKTQEDFTYGQLTSFIAYISQVLSSLMTVLMVFVTMTIAKASISRVNEVFDEVPTITDENADENNMVETGDIEFRNVNFKYSKDAVENVLENINLTIKEGETIGIIGGTGSSKTTLVNLIARLYDASEGEVLVSGKNVQDYKFPNLRQEISIVLQQNILFSGTIRENILWGDLGASQEDVERAAKAAQAHDFIMESDKGYDTEVGQGGTLLSGGQKQRLCIARSLLRNPKILILDDSTSAVDTHTDSKIREFLKSDDFKNTTKIVIAQRITSIMNADRIVVMENGKIDGVGSHDELVKSNEIYKEIFVSQQEGVLAQ